MTLKPIQPDINEIPRDFHPYLFARDAELYDSSCSEEARVIFIRRRNPFSEELYFLKSAPKGSLRREADMTRYLGDKGLSAEVIGYLSEERDWLMTVGIPGDDCTAEKYLAQPERLCDTIAETLAMLHAEDHTGCSVPNHTELYLAQAERNMREGTYDKSHFPDSFGYSSAEEAWAVIEKHARLLKTDTLLHGDYCLPNIILDDWRFSGFIDLGGGGVGDRHVDIFWGIWTLFFNLKTDKYRQRFIDAYDRDRVDEEMLRVVAAIEVFG